MIHVEKDDAFSSISIERNVRFIAKKGIFMKSLLVLATSTAFLLASFAVAQDSTPIVKSDVATTYGVDFSQVVGKIKPLNGINLWADFSSARIEDDQELAVACNFSTSRLHDAAWDDDGMRVVDVHQIFANLDADPSAPDNYYFEPTDDYLARILDAGVVPIYRLGTGIEHTKKPYFAKKPKDYAQYAEICAGIVRHYVKGWANGKKWNLPYWEIWNEPNLVPNMWDDPDWNSYCDFYVVVAKRLRSEFPDIKIGEPALTHASVDLLGKLIDRCKEENAPLDFLSWHCYPREPKDVLDSPGVLRKLLNEKGFEKTELHLNEWHYFPCDWSDVQGGDPETARKIYTSPEGVHGIDSAAFNDFVLTRWQDVPLDMANYYLFGNYHWGLFDEYGTPRPTYYSFVLFGKLVKSSSARVATIDEGGEIALIAGVDSDGASKKLLVSAFKNSKQTPIQIKLNGVPSSGKVSVERIGADAPYAESELEYSNGVLELPRVYSGVYLISF